MISLPRFAFRRLNATGVPSRLPAGGSTWFTVAAVGFGLVVLVRQFVRGHSYWYDESYLLLNIFARSHAELLGPLNFFQVAPPAYLWLLRSLYEWFGASECVMRLPAFLAAAGALILFALLARRVLGTGMAGWATAAFAICPKIVSHGCEVKPYAIDVFFGVAAALGAVLVLTNGLTRQNRFVPFALTALAILGPWFSFPSVFVFAASSAALFADGLIARSRNRTFFALVLGFAASLSSLAVWLIAARHHACPFLNEYWEPYLLPHPATLTNTAAWLFRCEESAAVYAVPDLGPIIVALFVTGIIVTLRRQCSLGALLAGPLAFGLLGAALGKYPMGERLTFFAAPGLLLLAFVGVEVLLARLPQRAAWLRPLLLVGLLVPGLTRDVPLLFQPAACGEYREAFAWVEARRESGDSLWVSHAEVYKVYHGTDRPVWNPLVPIPKMLGEIRGRRVWVVTTCDTGNSGEAFGTVAALHAAGWRESLRQPFCSVNVIRFEPPRE